MGLFALDRENADQVTLDSPISYSKMPNLVMGKSARNSLSAHHITIIQSADRLKGRRNEELT